MKLHFQIAFALIVLLSGIFLLGCSVLVPPTPTPTPAPTNTPTAVPTATVPLATATATPVTLPSAIAFALNKTQQLKSLQFEFESGVTLVKDGKTTQVPGLTMKGEDSTENRHVTLTGTTSDTHQVISYEITVLGAAVYIKGLNGRPGIDPNQWYQLPDTLQQSVRNLPTARGLIASFTPDDFTSAQFEKEGSEYLDDQTCSIWSARNATSAQALMGVASGSDLRNQLGDIDTTEFKIYTCADGFIHLMSGQVAGHDPAAKANTSTVALRFHMTDFDQALNIQAPTDAKLFQPPTPRPTALPTTPSAETPTVEGTPAETTPTEATPAEATPTPTP